ncbi:MAG: DUF3618 domain-containing protein [Bowdeniella nasicola]|nr:DUF3618 domain-containing protein [Bowdeniella nasicola]
MSEEKDNRSVKDIQKDLDRRRKELADSVNQLANRVNPKSSIESVKASFMSKAKDASKSANSATDDAKRAAKVFADEASMHAKVFMDDVKRGDTKTIAIAGVAAASLVALIGLSLKR